VEQALPGGSPQGGLLSIIIFCIYTSGCGMSMSEDIKESLPQDFPKMPYNQPMRTDSQIRLKYIDDTSLAAKLALEELFVLKEKYILPEFLFEDKTDRELTDWEMSKSRNTLHEMIEDVETFAHINFMKINEGKTKIMLFNNKKKDGVLHYHSKDKPPPECDPLEHVDVMKILGFQFQADMKVSEQVKQMLTKGIPKIWGLRQLMSNGGTREDGKQYYISWILSLYEFSVPVWHGRLSKHESASIERVQKKCLKIILGKKYLNYQNALNEMNLKTMFERRENLCFKFVKKAAKFHPKLYPKKDILRETRLGDKAPLHIPKFKTELHRNSGKVFLANLYNSRLDQEATKQASTKKTPKILTRKKGRCGNCEKCMRPNCGTCKFCKDMKQFGGPNKLKQACIARKCKV
jgi:hypothetical protein